MPGGDLSELSDLNDISFESLPIAIIIFRLVTVSFLPDVYLFLPLTFSFSLFFPDLPLGGKTAIPPMGFCKMSKQYIKKIINFIHVVFFVRVSSWFYTLILSNLFGDNKNKYKTISLIIIYDMNEL